MQLHQNTTVDLPRYPNMGSSLCGTSANLSFLGLSGHDSWSLHYTKKQTFMFHKKIPVNCWAIPSVQWCRKMKGYAWRPSKHSDHNAYQVWLRYQVSLGIRLRRGYYFTSVCKGTKTRDVERRQPAETTWRPRVMCPWECRRRRPLWKTSEKPEPGNRLASRHKPIERVVV